MRVGCQVDAWAELVCQGNKNNVQVSFFMVVMIVVVMVVVDDWLLW